MFAAQAKACSPNKSGVRYGVFTNPCASNLSVPVPKRIVFWSPTAAVPILHFVPSHHSTMAVGVGDVGVAAPLRAGRSRMRRREPRAMTKIPVRVLVAEGVRAFGIHEHHVLGGLFRIRQPMPASTPTKVGSIRANAP